MLKICHFIKAECKLGFFFFKNAAWLVKHRSSQYQHEALLLTKTRELTQNNVQSTTEGWSIRFLKKRKEKKCPLRSEISDTDAVLVVTPWHLCRWREFPPLNLQPQVAARQALSGRRPCLLRSAGFYSDEWWPQQHRQNRRRWGWWSKWSTRRTVRETEKAAWDIFVVNNGCI